MHPLVLAMKPASIRLSAPHANVSATEAEVAGADKFGAAVTYTCPTTRNIRFLTSGTGGGASHGIYNKNSGTIATFNSGSTLSMATGDTLAIGIATGRTAGVVTVRIQDAISGVIIDVLTLTVT